MYRFIVLQFVLQYLTNAKNLPPSISRLSGQSTHRCLWGQHYAPAALYPQEDSWYLFLVEAESTPGPQCCWKNIVNWKNEWPHRESNPRPSVLWHSALHFLISLSLSLYIYIYIYTSGGQTNGNIKKLKNRIYLCWLHGKNFSWQHWMVFFRWLHSVVLVSVD
jgi:hypothetical protein